MKPTLLVMAAGMGSRFGGAKQIEPVGPNGETLLDYSVFDAIRAGFDRVVFIIRKDFEAVFRERLHTVWSEVWGDRRQELVFIGRGMDRAAITAALDACLVGSAETPRFDPDAYRHLPDPFPAWRRAAA